MSKLTWDWIFDRSAQQMRRLIESIEQNPSGNHLPQMYNVQSYEALIMAVDMFSQHVALANNVATLSLATLCWFPQKNYEIQVCYDPREQWYQVVLYKQDTLHSPGVKRRLEQKVVQLDELADIVLAFMEKTNPPTK